MCIRDSDYTERSDDVVRMLKLLLDHGADPNAAPVLAVAARRGLAPVVSLLVDSGADPNRDAGRPNEEHTPLIAAAGGPSPDPAIVKRLVLSGATAARAALLLAELRTCVGVVSAFCDQAMAFFKPS